MALNPLHELHRRRASRNIGLLLVLLAFVGIVFGLTLAKIQGGDMMEGFDHQPRSSLLPRDPDARPRIPQADAQPTAAQPTAAQPTAAQPAETEVRP